MDRGVPLEAAGVTRRQVLGGASALALLAVVPGLLDARRAAAAAGTWLFFSAHQADVVREATARLIPGPSDDPVEAAMNSPGAREADVTRYVDTLLAAFDVAVPTVHAGGPWSDRHGGATDDMARFVPLTAPEVGAWEKRVAGWQKQYVAGVKALDGSAGGDFTAVPAAAQDVALSQHAEFRSLLMGHAIEGCYAVPEYGGNAGTVVWKDIGFPGDVQPTGYAPSQVSASTPPDPMVLGDDLSGLLKQHLPEVVPLVGAARAGRAGQRRG